MTGNPQKMVGGKRIRVAPMSTHRVEVARAAERLNAELIVLATLGQRPRCGDPGGRELWQSEVAADRAQAAVWCRGCPVLEQCGALADIAGEKHGVWGGIDRETRNRPTKERPPTANDDHNPASTTEGNQQMTTNPDQEAQGRETVARLFPQDPDGPHPQARPLRERPAPSGLFAERRTDAGIFTPRTTDTDQENPS